MSQISKQALLVDNNQSFPTNNAGEITPSDLRAFNVNMIDSTVNQTVYTNDSASWNVQIGQLNAFTASQQPSFNQLNSFTASQLVTNTALNQFTQSANQELDSLSAWTGSWNAWTSSLNEIRDDGVLQGYSTRFFFNGLVSASVVANVNGAIANVTVEQDGTKLSTSSFNSYTASTAASQSIFSASVATSISQSSNALSLLTASYATTGSNTFVADQTVSASILLTGNVTMNKDINAGILFPMDTGSVRIQRNAGADKLVWVDGLTNDKLLTLDIQTREFKVSGSLQAGLQNGYAWVGQTNGYSSAVPSISTI